MLKVFLVEDEIVMREGIKNNINWSEEGFEFAGEASDGELAYPMIQKVRPDILLTDIKMPFMDGLELSRLIRQEMPDIKIIILSGYDEFEYAKEAINIGITDYLVKPVSGAQLLAAVKKVEKLILEERQQRDFLHTFEKERMENAQLARQKFFRGLISGKRPVSELLKEGRDVGMDLAAKRYNIVLFQVFMEGKVEGYSEEQNAVTAVIEEMTERSGEILMIELGMEGWAFILKETEEKDLEQIQTEFLERIQNIFQGHTGIEYFGGAGQPVGRLSELGRCFEEASRAFAYRYLKKRNQIIFSASASEEGSEDEELTLRSLNVEKLDRRVVENFLKTGLKSEAVHFIDEYLASLGERNVQSLLFRQYVTMDMYFATVSVLEQMGYGTEELVSRCGDFQKMTAELSTVEQAKEYVKKIFETAIDLREKASSRKYRSLLQDARAYIGEHYDNEDISLNSVAASVNLSPNHFSTIFSQEMGQTFIEYLTSVRMEKAKELLRSTTMKTAEISYAVGYKDPHYFSYLFKKTQECTPREFRAGA